MKNTVIRLVIILSVVSFFPLGYLYYYYPRTVKYELAFEINKPDSTFDRSYFIGFDYVENKDWLMYYLIESLNKSSSPNHLLKGYDNVFLEDLASKMDFDRYDFIVTYQKRLVKLQHSPYLTREKDGLYFDDLTPLIPTWDTEKTDKNYIYRIKKNKRFRAPGP